MDIHERWESVAIDQYCKFDKVENKRCNRPDLHAYMLLNELFPGEGDMVCAAAHDVIWLDVDDAQVEQLTDEQIVELARCGIMHDRDGGLSMFT